ncbi:hypothetical protein GS532_21150 [Rhodococcus hoagii]|uniref:DUF6221 family protein n=1 Tax=Rhodococcus hoagii TaxID=43767 RepID=UPI00111C904B|nr:DUF6221 family protein [Prescottella equi]MBM4686241.1 hypothetical protein [Prescottella equi]
MELIDFLHARINEDEQAAHNAASMDGHDWAPFGPGADDFDRVEGTSATTVGYDMGDSAARHIARHDPARALREAGAKRRTIELVKAIVGNGGWWEGGKAEDILYDLAAVYSDHPDYNTEWAS